MAPPISNDLNSPVSLLWAHQLRREHAQVITQLEQIEELHPSALELKKLVTRTEKAETASKQIRKELTELKNAHQKNVKVSENLEELNAKEKARELDVANREKEDENARVEIKRLSESLAKQQGELASIWKGFQKVQRHVEEGNAATEQKLAKKEDEIVELRGLIQALQQKVDDAVSVIKDSVDCTRKTVAPMAPSEDISTSDADPFDLDANVQTAAADIPSEPILGPSLAMIKEPTLRYSQRMRGQPLQSLEESMQTLLEPSLPPFPQQAKRKPVAGLPGRAGEPNLNFAQGKTNLSTYIQVANSEYQERQPDEEEQFVDAFVHGLRDKRNRKRCEKKFREARKTWKTLKECFPVASQQLQGGGANMQDMQEKKVGQGTQQIRDITPELPPLPTKENQKIENGVGKGGRAHHSLLASHQPQGNRIKIRSIQEKKVIGGNNIGQMRHVTPALPPLAKENIDIEKKIGMGRTHLVQPTPAMRTRQVQQNNRGTEQAPESRNGVVVQKRAAERAPPPQTPAAARKRPFGELDKAQGEIQQTSIFPPGKKKKKDLAKAVAAARKKERTRPPSIPILASSEDEFA